MSNIKKSEEDVIRNVSNYLLESEQYFKLLAKINLYKTPRVIINTVTGETSFDYGDDLPIEKDVKDIITSLKRKYELL